MAEGAFKTEGFISYDLAKWASELTFESLSPEAVQAAKLFLYDSVGCALGGSAQEDVHKALAHYKQMGGAQTCSTFVHGFRTNPVDASFLNGLMIRAMDYNDIYWKQDPSHPSDIISAATSICEMKGLSGKELIVGIVIAYEIEMRLCEAGFPGVREYGWHHATLTQFASPFVAGRLLGLSVNQLVAAAGISASRACSLGAVTAGKLTNMKNTVDPWAARMGVESALLAELGYTGPEHIFDGKEGLFHVFGHAQYEGKPCRFDEDILIGDLPSKPGDRYRITECGMKSFPIEALSHAPLTAMMRIVKDHSLNPEAVAEIKVEVVARAADILGDPHKYRPTSKETADHSLPYSLAVGLADGMVTPLQFKQERIDDPGLIPIMDKVKVVPNQEFEELFPEFQPSRVTLTLTDGSSHEQRVDVPKGDPRDPMTEEEISVKFNALADGVVPPDACIEIRDWIMNADGETDMARLFRVEHIMSAEAFIEATLYQWSEIRGYAKNLVADLSQEDMIAQPVSGVVMNHPSWILSHLGVYGPMCAKMFRGEPAEDPLNHRFGRNSTPESDASVYLPRDKLVAHFVGGYDDAASALRDVDPARLNDPTPIERFRPRFPTIAYLPTQFFLKHTSTHLGQLSAWRRAGGRPPV